MPFKNREEAARLLAEKLVQYKGQNPLILGIPRGAVPMAKIIADFLEGDLDVALVHKLRAPYQPELAIGSVDETGHVYLGKYARAPGVDEAYIAEEKETQVEALRRRRALLTPIHPPISPIDRIVIVVDNGVATGASMIAALRAVRVRRPKRLIASMAVAPYESLQEIKKLSDEVVCLEVPADFYAVGQFFEEFRQVSDEEVAAILRENRSASGRIPP
ncbi:MAG TPA: phosphoribosyltransferase family protein [Candidatus Manganitrophaceae bacterium]|nr:phosphoribosyltransferase family protein [Candidatus Manganitrophaceae bacterium]